MADAVDRFFGDLADGGDQPWLRTVVGTVRFDVKDDSGTDHWVVGMDRGAVTVTHGAAGADCVIGGPRRLLGEVFRGESNAMAAVLRGALTCAGDLDLIFAVQRLFPGPPDSDPTRGSERHG